MTYYYLCAVFTLISASISLVFSVVAHQKAKQQEGDAAVNAKYAMARSASLCLVSFGLLIFKSAPYLIALSAIMIIVQLLDGIIGIKISMFKTVGPFFTAIVNGVLLILFLVNRS